jgi:apolipoprotein N-acyltransferase
MGEYIPFEFCRKLAARYGIAGSFTPGKHAVLWSCEKLPFGVSICYEETFGNLMRENREKGARFLLNLTSDAWFPLSKLPLQHYEHAKLRAVENGIPLFRACNTGVTAAVDPLGRERAALPEIETGALRVEMPLQHFQTFYAHFGEIPLLLACSFLLALGLLEMVSLPILIPNLEKK